MKQTHDSFVRGFGTTVLAILVMTVITAIPLSWAADALDAPPLMILGWGALEGVLTIYLRRRAATTPRRQAGVLTAALTVTLLMAYALWMGLRYMHC